MNLQSLMLLSPATDLFCDIHLVSISNHIEQDLLQKSRHHFQSDGFISSSIRKPFEVLKGEGL